MISAWAECFPRNSRRHDCFQANGWRLETTEPRAHSGAVGSPLRVTKSGSFAFGQSPDETDTPSLRLCLFNPPT